MPWGSKAATAWGQAAAVPCRAEPRSTWSTAGQPQLCPAACDAAVRVRTLLLLKATGSLLGGEEGPSQPREQIPPLSQAGITLRGLLQQQVCPGPPHRHVEGGRSMRPGSCGHAPRPCTSVLCWASHQYPNHWGCDLSAFLYWGSRAAMCHFNSSDMADTSLLFPQYRNASTVSALLIHPSTAQSAPATKRQALLESFYPTAF